MIVHTLYTVTSGKNLGRKWIDYMIERHIVEKRTKKIVNTTPPLVYHENIDRFRPLEEYIDDPFELNYLNFLDIWQNTGFMRQIIFGLVNVMEGKKEEYLKSAVIVLKMFEKITLKKEVYNVYVWHGGTHPHIHIFQVSTRSDMLYFNREQLYYLRALAAGLYESTPSWYMKINTLKKEIKRKEKLGESTWFEETSLANIKENYRKMISELNRELKEMGVESASQLIRYSNRQQKITGKLYIM